MLARNLGRVWGRAWRSHVTEAPVVRLGTNLGERRQVAEPRLLVKHGEQRASGAGGAGAGNGTLAAELIEVTIRSIAGDTANLPPCSRRLPNGLPLKSVKMIACQLFKLEPTKQQLLYTPPGGEKDIPEPLDDDTKSLADLGVETGGCIVIDEVLD